MVGEKDREMELRLLLDNSNSLGWLAPGAAAVEHTAQAGRDGS